MPWCTLDWVAFEGLSDRKDGPRRRDGLKRKAFQAEGTEHAKTWSRGELGALEDLRGHQYGLRGRKGPGCAGLWRPSKIWDYILIAMGKLLKSF